MSAKKWMKFAVKGWNASAANDTENALKHWRKADSIGAMMSDELGPGIINPELSLLRHNEGSATGLVVCPTSTEDRVIGIQQTQHVAESSEIGKDFKLAEINGDRLAENIGRYHSQIGKHHLLNNKKALPHLLVMSTGRCGTMSLLRLLQRSQYVAYHQCLFNTAPSMRFEAMARHMEGYYDHNHIDEEWMRTRAAEWLGPMSEGRPAALCSHLDTIWAPLFAMVHPMARFVYLRRDPARVFQSFHSKGQWSNLQLGPMYYKLQPFGYRKAPFDTPHQIAWYIKFTEAFSRAMGEVFADRWIEISSDKLFAQNEVEIKRLRDFLELDLPFHEVKDHFAHVHNEKAHKVTLDDRQIAAGVQSFEKIYAKM